jgi:putative chitinase
VAAGCGFGPGHADRETLPAPCRRQTTTLRRPRRGCRSTTQKGDTLQGISDKLGIAIAELAAANGITDPNKIQAGQRLTVPPAAAAPPPAATTTAAP